MASPLQNRIVGTAILIALAVIFLPDLLDGEKVSRDDELETIPLRPALTVDQAEPEFPQDFEQRVEEAQPQPINEDVFNAPREPVSVTLGDNPETPAWVVRLGAFRNADNVQRLVRELRDNGFSAYSRSMQSDSGELRVLYVGPDLDAEVLRDQLADLKALTGLDGQLVPYQPTAE
ncbi:MAG: SPOR domain-containing protein [Idiomarina sp.]|nr:SPOR domain-containing protein [Idiomarina sp.]